MHSTIPEYVLDRLLRLFYLEKTVSKALLFGSRAKGIHRNNSDIDIALVGSGIPKSLNTKLREAARLYPIDIVNMEACDNKDLLDEIKKDGIVIYERK